MTKINFFTPIVNKNSPDLKSRVRQKVDNYFYLGGKKAYVLDGKTKDSKDKIVISKSHASGLEIAGKILSYSTIVIPIIMLGTKAILRAESNYKVIDPKKKLEKGIQISDEQIEKINTLLPQISKGEDHEEIEWLQKGQANLVFRLKDDLSIVYKFSKKKKNDQRYKNMIKAKEICLVNHLSHLVIPHSKIIEVGKHRLIAEEAMDIAFNATAQEELYHTCSKDLTPTVKELATFVAKTGFNDIAWRNIPIINEQEDHQGTRRVALIDLEHMRSVANGFKGDVNNGSIGLIRCVSESHIDVVIKQGRKKGASLSGPRTKIAKNRRLEELKEDKKLRTFYAEKGIITGKEPINVDIDTLGLNLEKTAKIKILNEDLSIAKGKLVYEEKEVTLKDVTETVIAEINRQLENSNEQASIKGKRSISIDIRRGIFSYYERGGLGQNLGLSEAEDNKNNWINQIILALTETEHIFELKNQNGNGYFLQV